LRQFFVAVAVWTVCNNWSDHVSGVVRPNPGFWRGTMESVLNNLNLMAKDVKDTLTDFLLNHSEIEPCRAYGDEVVGFDPDGDRSYAYLDEAGRKLQSALSESYGKYYAALQLALKDQPEDVLSKMAKSNVIIVRTIEHRLTWCENTRKALDRALGAFEEQAKILNAVYGEKSRKA
jgi:hypothetical protein